MKHPIPTSELDKLQPRTFYSDIYLDGSPIGDVTRYWTKLLLDNGIRLEQYVTNDGWDGSFYRPLYKTFPWEVDIIHMYSERNPSLYGLDCYKVCFNLECREVIVDDGQECEVMLVGDGSVSLRHVGQIGYSLSKKERDFTENLFKGKWVEYLDIQGSRIIVQFRLENYYPIFRREKILKIKNKSLSL